jgi:transposase
MKKILAIDLGKFNSEACVFDKDTGEIRFQRIASSRSYIERLLDRERPDVVVFEACTMAGWIYDLCQKKGVDAKVANTCSEAWKFKHLKRKTDRDDAERLAHLEAMGELPEVRMPAVQVRERRSLIKYRQSLVDRRVAVQNEIRSVFLGQGIEIPRGHRAWTVAGMSELRQHARPLLECSPSELWNGQLYQLLEELEEQLKLEGDVQKKLDEMGKADPATQLLTTMPGIGRRTAEVVAVYVDDPKRFSNSGEVSGYSGLVPRQYQSGEVDRRGRITRRGPGLLRKVLVEAAWCMLRRSEWARQIVTRISRGQRTRKKQAIIALARKMLVRMWAMLRDGVPWRDGPSPIIARQPAMSSK